MLNSFLLALTLQSVEAVEYFGEDTWVQVPLAIGNFAIDNVELDASAILSEQAIHFTVRIENPWTSAACLPSLYFPNGAAQAGTLEVVTGADNSHIPIRMVINDFIASHQYFVIPPNGAREISSFVGLDQGAFLENTALELRAIVPMLKCDLVYSELAPQGITPSTRTDPEMASASWRLLVIRGEVTASPAD